MSVCRAEDAELEHGRGDPLDARLVHRADRVTGQGHGRGHPGRQLVVPCHGGLDRGSVAGGEGLPLLDRPHERGRGLRVLVSREMVVIGEPFAVTSARVSGRRIEASARMRNLAPAACAAM
jgi:hypothetical protein